MRAKTEDAEDFGAFEDGGALPDVVLADAAAVTVPDAPPIDNEHVADGAETFMSGQPNPVATPAIDAQTSASSGPTETDAPPWVKTHYALESLPIGSSITKETNGYQVVVGAMHKRFGRNTDLAAAIAEALV